MSDVEDLDELGVDDDGDGSGAAAPTARTVLEYLVGALVDDQGAVTIDVDEGRVVALRVRVAPDDMGRVIGRRGRIANAIRTVVRAAAVRDGVEVDVDFVD
jgi:uncharacterized protein